MERDQCWLDPGWCSWLEFVSACLTDELPTGFSVALVHLWFCWFGLVRNEITSITKSQKSRAGIPSMRKPESIERLYLSFNRNVWNRCLLLAPPTYWHERLASENAQNSSLCWLRVFQVSCKIRVLKQSKSALLCCVSHIPILPEFTCVMNVRGQTRQTFSQTFVHYATARASLFTDHMSAHGTQSTLFSTATDVHLPLHSCSTCLQTCQTHLTFFHRTRGGSSRVLKNRRHLTFDRRKTG